MSKSTETVPFASGRDLYFRQVDSQGQSVLMYRLAGNVYPVKVVAGCKTCGLKEWRIKIENDIVMGVAFKTIYEDLPDDIREQVSYDSIRNHYNRNHMPLAEQMKRIVMDQVALEAGIDPNDHEGTLINHVGFARLGVQLATEDMLSGRQRPTLQEAIAMAGLLQKVDDKAGSKEELTREVVVELLHAYWEATGMETSSEQQENIARRLSANPKLHLLSQRLEQITAQAEA